MVGAVSHQRRDEEGGPACTDEPATKKAGLPAPMNRQQNRRG